MDDMKKTYREGEQATKEAWREADGESVADHVGNVGDEIRKQAGNAGRRPRHRSRRRDGHQQGSLA